MTKAPLVAAALLTLLVPFVASAHGRHHHRGPQVPPVVSPVVPPVVTPPSVPTPPIVPTPPVVTVNEITLQAYTTGYGWPDNTPKGSATISNPVIHSLAGGSGTYADPITLAVGHTISGGKDTLDYPAGTKFYIPNLKKYFIVEDTCGDGNSPQSGPCHTGYQGHVWLDLWVGGNSSNQSQTLSCEDAITDIHTVIENPASTYPVVSGDVASGCQQFGN